VPPSGRFAGRGAFNFLTQGLLLELQAKGDGKMPKGKSLDEVIAAAEKILRVWEANPTFTLGEITKASFKALLDELRDLRAQTEETRRQLTNFVNTTNDKAISVNDVNSRALSGIRAVFGPDSTQYEEAGGTRSSERKKASKQKPTS
jgi:hypothetical protein